MMFWTILVLMMAPLALGLAGFAGGYITFVLVSVMVVTAANLSALFIVTMLRSQREARAGGTFTEAAAH